VEQGCRIVVKGKAYDVARLVGDEKEAKKYTGGQFAVVYLSPSDYHRVHAPIGGHVPWVRGIGGDLFPVNRIGERAARSLLVENERVVVPIDTTNQGRMLVILVGAMIVGRISVAMLDTPDVPPGIHDFSPPYPLDRGSELGVFHLGSTVVLLSGPDAPTWKKTPGPIRVGASLEMNE
jgi:phosphatidylserine decarboxylase